MASPSATSSYLIRASSWDDEAEAYLRLAISNGEGNNSGGVPSAYPSTDFELTWVVSTLLEAGVWVTKDPTEIYNNLILSALDASIQAGKGLVGFAPCIEPDLDDSAKASIIFSLLGRSGFTSRIVKFFESTQGLKTYRAERNPSVSANCNALLSIVLDSDEYPTKTEAIEKVTAFICNTWWRSSGTLNDKWNLSPFYSSMLMARSMMELLTTWEQGRYTHLSRNLLQERVIPTLFQCLIRTLQSQQPDGSWGRKGPREETSYAVLTLASLLGLPVAQPLRPRVRLAINRGRRFLSISKISQPECLWIEKTSFGSKNLANAYSTAALYTFVDQKPLGEQVKGLCGFSSDITARQQSPEISARFSNDAEWVILAASMEARLWAPQLRKTLHTTFQSSSVDVHFEKIAFRWILASTRLGSTISSQFLSEMISASIINEHLIASINDQGSLEGRNAREEIVATINGDLDVHRKGKPGLDDQAISHAEHPRRKIPDTTSIKSESNDVTEKTIAIEGDPVKCNSEDLSFGVIDSDDTNTGSSLIRYFQSHPSLLEADAEDKAALKQDIERFLLAIASGITRQSVNESENQRTRQKMDQHMTQPYGQRASRCFEGLLVDCSSQFLDTSGFHLLLTFANCLEARRGTEKGKSAAHERIENELHGIVANIARLIRELDDARCCNSLIRRDEVRELVAYEKAKSDLGLESLKRLGIGDEALTTIRLVLDVAELQGLEPI